MDPQTSAGLPDDACQLDDLGADLYGEIAPLRAFWPVVRAATCCWCAEPWRLVRGWRVPLPYTLPRPLPPGPQPFRQPTRAVLRGRFGGPGALPLCPVCAPTRQDAILWRARVLLAPARELAVLMWTRRCYPPAHRRWGRWVNL